MKFLLIIGHDDNFGPNPSLVSQILKWNSKMVDAGILQDSNPLVPWQDAKTIRIRDGKLVVESGSFTTSDEKIAAYVLVLCSNEKHAIEIASTHPMAKEAVIEVRQVWENIAEET